MSPSRLRKPDRAHPDLQPLLEFSHIVNSSVDLQFILNTLLFTVMGKMLLMKGMVLLGKSETEFEVVVSRGVDSLKVGRRVSIPKPPRSPSRLQSSRISSQAWIQLFKNAGLDLAVPIVARKQVVGMLVLGERMGGKNFSQDDQKLLQSLVGLSGAAVEKAMFVHELKEANRNLDRKYQELNTLFELSKEFNVGLDAQRVVRLLTFSLLGQIGVSRYVICYEDDRTQTVVASKGDIPLDASVFVRILADLKGGVLLRELSRKKKYAASVAKLINVGLQAAIPLNVQHQAKGMIFLGEKLRGGDYTKGDLEFLYALGNLACVSIENARLFQETLEKQRMEDELAIAREIQQGLLPQSLPKIPGFDIAAINVSSKQVGGDYYDVVSRADREYVIAIGDVSGKGTPAALLMANVQAAMRALSSMSLPLSEATARINDLTTDNTGMGRFITFFWGVLNAETKELCYVNAGHNPPFLVHTDGSIQRLEAGGMILGMMKTVTPYSEGRVTLDSGDVLFLFTDGVSEAMNAEDVDFTEELLLEVVKSARGKSSQDIIQNVRDAVNGHTRGTPQSDDITMLVVKAL